MIWGPGAAWNLPAVVANRTSGGLVPISQTQGGLWGSALLILILQGLACLFRVSLSLNILSSPEDQTFVSSSPPTLIASVRKESHSPGRQGRFQFSQGTVTGSLLPRVVSRFAQVCRCLSHPCDGSLSEEAFCL